MHTRKYAALLAVLFGLLTLTACGAGSNSTPTVDPNTVRTQVMLTVEFESTREAALTPSATVTLPPSNTPAVTATRTKVPLTATPRPSQTRTTTPDIAEMAGQSIADRTRFTPGAPIKLAWTLKNVGTTTWGNGYALKFFSGDKMGAQDSIPLPKEVKPGESVEVIVDFVAPTAIGLKRSNWVLQNSTGINFYPMWIEIEVASDLPSPTAAESTATVTPTVAAGG